MSTFQAPVRVSAPGTNADPGDVMVSQTGDFAYDDATDTYLFTIPKGAWIQEFYVDVPSAAPFNAGTTNILHIGDMDGGFTYFASIEDVNVAGRFNASDTASASQLDNWVDTEEDRRVTATYAQSGTAATQGSAKITAVYTLASANLA